MIELSSTSDLLASLATAQRIDAQAYTLPAALARALEAAAERGANVSVRLEGAPHIDPGGRLAAYNRQLVDALQAAGADASLADHVHAKTIDADGSLYLDDRNWRPNDLVLRDTDTNDPAVARMKGDALKLEGDLLRRAGKDDEIVVATESLGGYNPTFDALQAIARQGRRPCLLVYDRDLAGNGADRSALDALAAQGVRIRVCADSEKFALVGNRAWIGSANATAAFDEANMTDWGACTNDPAIVAEVRRRLETQWSRAKPFVQDPTQPGPQLVRYIASAMPKSA